MPEWCELRRQASVRIERHVLFQAPSVPRCVRQRLFLAFAFACAFACAFGRLAFIRLGLFVALFVALFLALCLALFVGAFAGFGALGAASRRRQALGGMARALGSALARRARIWRRAGVRYTEPAAGGRVRLRRCERVEPGLGFFTLASTARACDTVG